MVRRRAGRVLGVLLVLGSLAAAVHADSKTVARCGQGFLEESEGRRVLHVQGTPYEMGFQHGTLLKKDIRELVRFLFDVKAKEFSEHLQVNLGGIGIQPDAKTIIQTITLLQKPHVPARFYEEMQGVADGSGVSYNEIVLANFIPELFHCSGFALSGAATKDGTLYHGRILDYGCDWRLQEHAVVLIAQPSGRIPFVNVTYAGFVGSVTGMNARQVAIGEMGGRGLGQWAGMPMAFLLRMALEEAGDLDAAIAVFRDHPRTCQYFYVISDGKTGQAVGMEASHAAFGVIRMGETHPLLPEAIPNAVVLSAGDRYKELARRVQEGLGTFDADSARHLMDRPVAMKSNLHSVLFAPASTRFWVANASKDGQPAVTQPYRGFQLTELLARVPDSSAPSCPGPANPPERRAEAVGGPSE